jgi:hypothetical protein
MPSKNRTALRAQQRNILYALASFFRARALSGHPLELGNDKLSLF